MSKLLKQLLILTCLVAVLMLPYFVFAQQTAPLNKLEAIRPGSGYEVATDTTLSAIIGKIVQAFLSLLGVIFIILMVYGGYNWMMSAGDEQKLTKAQDTIRRAVIGVIITAGAYAIWEFIKIYMDI